MLNLQIHKSRLFSSQVPRNTKSKSRMKRITIYIQEGTLWKIQSQCKSLEWLLNKPKQPTLALRKHGDDEQVLVLLSSSHRHDANSPFQLDYNVSMHSLYSYLMYKFKTTTTFSQNTMKPISCLENSAYPCLKE